MIWASSAEELVLSGEDRVRWWAEAMDETCDERVRMSAFAASTRERKSALERIEGRWVDVAPFARVLGCWGPLGSAGWRTWAWAGSVG